MPVRRTRRRSRRSKRRCLQWEGVAEVVYQRGVLEQIGQNINKFNMILLLFGGTLLIIALILLNNTIRVTIFSKRYIINTMKLVGATKWFIMRPFLSRSILQGIYAGLIAWAMLIVMMMGLHEGLPEIKFVSDDNYLALIFCRHDGRRRTYFAALYRFRCTEIPADEFEQDPIY